MNKEKIKERFNEEWLEMFIKKHESDLDIKNHKYGDDIGSASHICPVLRMLMLRTFICEFIYNIDKNDHKKMNKIREVLDGVLYTNQNIIRAIKKNENNEKPVFPYYFESLDIKEKDNCMIESEVYIQHMKKEISLDEELNEYDIRPYYIKISNILESTNLDRDKIFNRLLEHCEYGVYLGCLMKIETDNIDKKILIPDDSERKKLKYIQKKFRYGMEVRAKKLEKYFGKKLNEDSYIEYK